MTEFKKTQNKKSNALLVILFILILVIQFLRFFPQLREDSAFASIAFASPMVTGFIWSKYGLSIAIPLIVYFIIEVFGSLNKEKIQSKVTIGILLALFTISFL